MSAVEVRVHLSPEELFRAVEQLPAETLDIFLERANYLRASRRANHLSERETELLSKISEGLPESVWEEYHALVAKRKAEILALEEGERLRFLTHQVEMDNATRIGYVVELAQLQKKPVQEVMQTLGIGPNRHG